MKWPGGSAVSTNTPGTEALRWTGAFGFKPTTADLMPLIVQQKAPHISKIFHYVCSAGIQPEPLRKIANDTVDDGLLQRLLPIVLRPGTKSKDEPNGRATEQYEAMIERLLKMEEPFSHLRFDEGAMAIRERLESRHLELMNLESINKKLAAHIGKYDGLFVRLCLLWFCIEGAKGYRVTEQIANRVAAFLHQFLLRTQLPFMPERSGCRTIMIG